MAQIREHLAKELKSFSRALHLRLGLIQMRVNALKSADRQSYFWIQLSFLPFDQICLKRFVRTQKMSLRHYLLLYNVMLISLFHLLT